MKSSGGGGNAGASGRGASVSVPEPGQERASWWKSSYSDPDNGSACVEVRFPHFGVVAVRDSAQPALAVLHFPAEEWVSFIHQVKSHSF